MTAVTNTALYILVIPLRENHPLDSRPIQLPLSMNTRTLKVKTAKTLNSRSHQAWSSYYGQTWN